MHVTSNILLLYAILVSGYSVLTHGLILQDEYEAYYNEVIKPNSWEHFNPFLDGEDNSASTASEACRTSMTTYQAGVASLEEWALRMVDSTGDSKTMTNRFSGNMFTVGAYDQCLRVKATNTPVYELSDNATLPTIVGIHDFDARFGKLALSRWPYDLVWQGICIPATCTTSDIEIIFPELDPPVLAVKAFFQPKRVLSKDVGAIVTISVLAIFGFLVVAATLFEILAVKMEGRNNPVVRQAKIEPAGNETTATSQEMKRFSGSTDEGLTDNVASSQTFMIESQTTKQPGKARRALVSFSLYTNLPALFSTTVPKGTVGSINGLRFFATSWIVLGHVYMVISVNPSDQVIMERRFLQQIIKSMPIAVDIFFVLSAILVMMSFLKTARRLIDDVKYKSPISRFGCVLKELLLYVFHRYWRLTPVLVIIMLCTMFLFVYLGDGPLFPGPGYQYGNAEACKQSWWINLIYLQNFIGMNNKCLGWAWYLAVEFQFYLLVPVHAFLFIWHPAAGGIFAALCWIASMTCRIVFTQVSGIVKDTFNDYYVKPYTRYGPYVIGMVLGYIIHRTKGQVKIPKVTAFIGWFLSVSFAMLMVFGQFKRSCSPGIAGCIGWPHWRVQSLYHATHRDIFALCIAWVIFACINGRGGPLNRFLSWSLWVPLSRLTYVVYLVHLLVQDFLIATKRQVTFKQDITMVYIYFGNLALALIIAVVLTLMFEIPLLKLEKVILPQRKKTA